MSIFHHDRTLPLLLICLCSKASARLPTGHRKGTFFLNLCVLLPGWSIYSPPKCCKTAMCLFFFLVLRKGGKQTKWSGKADKCYFCCFSFMFSSQCGKQANVSMTEWKKGGKNKQNEDLFFPRLWIDMVKMENSTSCRERQVKPK